MPVVVNVLLLAFGAVAIVAGVLVYRSAGRFVTGASETLRAMFGEGFPGLFEREPDARGGHIAGVAFAIAGLGLVAFGVVRILAG